MAKEEKKAPKLRFNGYTNDWEQQELGAVVEFYSGLTYKPENVVQNGTLVIRSSNIHNNQYINADNVYVKNNIVNSEYVQEQDIIVVVRNGSRNLIGKHALLKSIPHDPSVIGAFMTGIRSLNNQFIEAVLNTEKFKREINKNLGATINQITTSQFKKMKFNFPKREEDKQIGILFNYLDDTIQLHERKCEELALIKQALLQKLFPKKDEVIPEVRYKSFSAAWEQRKLGGVAKFYSGGTPSVGVSDYYDGTIPFIRSAEINSTSTELYLSELGLQNSSAKMVHRGDILYALYGATSGEVGISKINGAINQAILAIIPHKGYNSEFLEQWLRKNKEAIIKTYLQGGQGNLSGAIVKQIKVSFPSFDEQQKIGKSFQKIDSLITLHQRKLEKLKQLKKFLLQNMFI